MQVPVPDRYRGIYRDPDTQLGQKYASHVQVAIIKAQNRNSNVSIYTVVIHKDISSTLAFALKYM